MSRNTIYSDNRLTVVKGIDHMLGNFYQIFDKELQDETPEGEGLVFDWSERFGFEVNVTGINNNEGPDIIIIKYIAEHNKKNPQTIRSIINLN